MYHRAHARPPTRHRLRGDRATATSGWALSYALALDASGIAHVAYWDGANGALRHAVRGADGTWRPEDVPGAGASSAVALAVDAAGKIHLVYRENATKSLVYVARTDAAWGAAETVDAVGGSTGSDAPNGVAPVVSLAVGADGQPRVAYLDAGSSTGSAMTCRSRSTRTTSRTSRGASPSRRTRSGTRTSRVLLQQRIWDRFVDDARTRR